MQTHGHGVSSFAARDRRAGPNTASVSVNDEMCPQQGRKGGGALYPDGCAAHEAQARADRRAPAARALPRLARTSVISVFLGFIICPIIATRSWPPCGRAFAKSRSCKVTSAGRREVGEGGKEAGGRREWRCKRMRRRGAGTRLARGVRGCVAGSRDGAWGAEPGRGGTEGLWRGARTLDDLLLLVHVTLWQRHVPAREGARGACRGQSAPPLRSHAPRVQSPRQSTTPNQFTTIEEPAHAWGGQAQERRRSSTHSSASRSNSVA